MCLYFLQQLILLFIIEYLELKGTQQNHQIHLLSTQRTIQTLYHVSESTVHMLGAMTTKNFIQTSKSLQIEEMLSGESQEPSHGGLYSRTCKLKCIIYLNLEQN